MARELTHPDVIVIFYVSRKGEFSDYVDDAFQKHLAKLTEQINTVKTIHPENEWRRRIAIEAPLWYH